MIVLCWVRANQNRLDMGLWDGDGGEYCRKSLRLECGCFCGCFCVIAIGAFIFSHLQLLATYDATKCNFQKIFSKLHLWLHIWLVAVADMVAYETSVC